MIPKRWQQVKNVLQEAIELPFERRKAFLDGACNGDSALRAEVESLLLQEGEKTEEFLRSPLQGLAQRLQQLSASWVGRRIGPYKIIEIIGEGGMGSVYRAARADDQYQKQVAIKLVRLGLGTPSALARFRTERQILANLEHPNIARLLDGGATEDGLPYVVMELVEGLAIDEYCNAHRLSLAERLRMFRTVCQAVQYAHQHLVVHRDLKPANILVTADGTPKLLDFGIAKILDDESLPGGAEATISVLRMLTPEYASPEQVRGETVTTASDVYSLGVILFLLLTGRHPYSFDSRAADAIVHAVCDTEPPKPSTAVRRMQASPISGKPTPNNQIAADGESAVKLGKQLRGDLDNMVLMALRKDPQRRYASAEQLAEDLRRHLASLPVTARKDTAGYRASKFVGRHRVGVTAAAAVLLTLLAGLVITLREAQIARQQTEIARQQRVQSEERFNDLRQVANSLMFEFHDAIKDLAGATPAKALLIQRSREYLDRLARDAKDDSSLQQELATAYIKLGDIQGSPRQADLGDAAGARASYAKALAILEPLLSAQPNNRTLQMQTASCYDRLAVLSSALQATDLLGKAVRINEDLVAHNSGDAKLRQDLAVTYADLSLHFGNPYAFNYILGAHQGLEYANKSLQLREQLHKDAPNDPAALFDLFEAYHYLADMLWVTGHLDQALHYQMSIRSMMVEFIKREPTNAEARRLLVTGDGRIGKVLAEKGRTAEAMVWLEPGFRGIIALGAADPKNVFVQRQVGSGYNQMGELLLKLGKADQAIQYHRKAVTLSKSVLSVDPTNPDSQFRLAGSYQALGNALAAGGKTREGLENSSRAVEIRKSLVAADPSDARSGYALARNYLDLGNIQAGGNPGQSLESYQSGIAILAPMVKTDLDNWLMERTLAVLYSGSGVATERIAHSAHPGASEATGQQGPACSFFAQELSLWQDMRRRNVLIESDLPTFHRAEGKVRDCAAQRIAMERGPRALVIQTRMASGEEVPGNHPPRSKKRKKDSRLPTCAKRLSTCHRYAPETTFNITFVGL
ncbi:MAG TPA: protein kinase [Terriglobales bacterium]|nr:protein kinase [Terriglobales bacterium]